MKVVWQERCKAAQATKKIWLKGRRKDRARYSQTNEELGRFFKKLRAAKSTGILNIYNYFI